MSLRDRLQRSALRELAETPLLGIMILGAATQTSAQTWTRHWPDRWFENKKLNYPRMESTSFSRVAPHFPSLASICECRKALFWCSVYPYNAS